MPRKKKQQKRLPDAKALAMLKASGILNRNVTLDELLKLSTKLDVSFQARGFIFRDFHLPTLLNAGWRTRRAMPSSPRARGEVSTGSRRTWNSSRPSSRVG